MTDPGDEPLLRIGAVARATGVAVSTLRSWESRYGIPLPARTAGGHRLYPLHSLNAVRDVQALVADGAATAAAAASVRAGTVRRPTELGDTGQRDDGLEPGDPVTGRGDPGIGPGGAAIGPGGGVPAPAADGVRRPGQAVVPLEALLRRTRAARAENRRLRITLHAATANATASLGLLHSHAVRLQAEPQQA